ncbi:MAG: hypothetical protein R3E12_08360 [Candidatus Eisenbacteria bacterium]
MAGTKDGVTAIQMDIKIKGLNYEILRGGVGAGPPGTAAHPRQDDRDPAGFASGDRSARAFSSSDQPGPDPGRHQPRGKTIKKICEDTGAAIDVEDDGTVKVACVDTG